MMKGGESPPSLFLGQGCFFLPEVFNLLSEDVFD